MNIIEEGGAAVNGRRILQSEVPTIIDNVDAMLTKLGLVKGEDWDVIGSAGKKRDDDTSGDVDIAIKIDRISDALKTSGKKETLEALNSFAISNGYENNLVQPGFSQVSVAMPINGPEDIVQVDLMCVRNLEWSKFTQASPDYRKNESKYKGHCRNVLMMCIVKHCFKRTTKRVTLEDDTIRDGEIEAYVIRLTDGLYKTRKSYLNAKQTALNKTENLLHDYDELITDTPQEFIDLIFNDATIDDFKSFETVYDAFMSDRFKFPEKRESILITYVLSLDGQNIDVPTEIDSEIVEKAREIKRESEERERLDKEAKKPKLKIKNIETLEHRVPTFEEFLNENKN